jgi:hypothetical protein
MLAQRGSKSIPLLIFNLDVRMRWAVIATPWPLYHRQSPGTQCKDLMVLRAVYTSAEKRKSLATTGVQSPNSPDHGELPVIPRYTGQHYGNAGNVKSICTNNSLSRY